MTTALDERQRTRELVRPARTETGSAGAGRQRLHKFGLVGAIVGTSLATTLLNSPGAYIADSRFEHYWASQQYLSRHQWLWDSFRGLGRIAPYFAPAVAGVLAAIAAAGVGAATAERLLHAIYLSAAGLGMVAVLRLYRPRLGLEHLLAALAYMFSPYTAQFLLPSGLFLHYAIAPWLLVAFARGIAATHKWKWPAAFAFTVLIVGSLNVPSLMYALFPLIPFVVFAVLVERSARWRDVLGFSLRAGALIALGSIATAIQLRGNAPVLAENLSTTELPSTVSRSSSWAESWRGLGFWLTYFRTTNGPSRPEAIPFFGDIVIVVSTFAVPIIAVSTLWWSRWRPRLLFAAMTIVSLVLMVGLFPITNPAPVGRLMDSAYDHLLFLRGLRSGYKAGAGFMIGTAALFGVGVADAVRRLRHSALESVPGPRRLMARLVPIAAVATLAVASFPFWTGSLYSPSDRMTSLPDYWQQAVATVNALPGDGRVLVLPGAERNRYRWGYLGDDLFDAELAHPHLLRQSFTQGMPETGSLLSALDERTANDRYTPGSFAPIARVLGVRWVLIRNDLAWQQMEAPRPSALDGLRHDPALRLVATFGQPGQNTTASDDRTAGLLGENRLAPVELYELANANDPVHVVASGEPLLVSGDGEGLVPLAADGVLDSSAGFRFSASTSSADLERLIGAGAPIVITDSNRRRATQVTSSHNFTSYTLPSGGELDRPPLDLFAVPGSQTVATFGDALRITSSAFGSALARYQNWFRPANAFDGNPDTAWRTAGGTNPAGEWVQVDLAQPHTLSAIRLTPSPVTATRRISQVELTFSDGTSVRGDIARGETQISFPSRQVSWFRVRIATVEGSGDASVGFSEITVPGLNLTEVVQAPDDVFRAGDSDARLASMLTHANFSYSFDRLEKLGSQDEEVDLRRRFRTAGDRTFDVSGTFRLGDSTPDAVIDTALGQPVGATSTARIDDPATGRAGLAVDGRADTAWTAPPDAGTELTTHFPTQLVSTVDVSLAAPTAAVPRYSDISKLSIRLDNGPARTCLIDRSATSAGTCHIDFVPVLAGHVDVQVVDVVAEQGALGPLPMGIAEVVASGPAGPVPTAAAPTIPPPTCMTIATVDDAPLAVHITGTLDDLLAGKPVTFASCGPVTLTSGWHDLVSTANAQGLIAHLDLSTGTLPRGLAGSAGTTTVFDDDPAHATIRVDTQNGGTVVLGQSYASGWKATVDGHTIAATPLDTMSAWRVAPGATSIDVTYAPQRTYELGLAAMAAIAALCLVLMFRREPSFAELRPSSDTAWLDRNPQPVWHRAVPLTAAIAVIGFLFANLEGAVLGVAAVVAARLAGLRLIGRAAMGAMALTAVTTVLVTLPATPAGVATFAADRRVAGVFGQLTAVLVATYVVLAALGERASAPRYQPEVDRRGWRIRLGQGWRRRVTPTIAAAAAATLVAATVGDRSNGRLVFLLATVATSVVGGLALVEAAAAVTRQRRVTAVAAPSHLLQGSMWLMAGFVVQAVTGVGFWIVAARVDAAVDVGRATALFASLQFVTYATAMGLPEMLMRFSSTRRDDADVLLTWTVLVTTATSILGTAVYVALAATSQSSLSPVTSAGGALIFLLVSVGAAIALLVDARLMTARRWRWVFGRLVAVGAVRIPLVLVPAPIDPAVWLFVVIAAPIAVSGALGLWVLKRDEGVRLRLRPTPASSADATRYALVSYVSHLALSAPQFALPVIVLMNVDAVENANFFVAWSIAAVAFILPVTIGRVLLAEGSRTEHMLESQTSLAFRLGVGLMVVASAVTFVARPLVVLLYGPDYETAARILPLLVLGGVPWSITAIALGRARVRHDHVATVAMTATLATTILGAALVVVPSAGVDGAVRAWLVGTTLSAVVAGLVGIRRRRAPSAAEESVHA